MSEATIRGAVPDDVPTLFALVRALAEYERAPERVTGTEDLLARALFGSEPLADAVLAEIDGEAVGFAVFYTTFSTWQCLPGVWLEDLFVLPHWRRHGVGRALLAHLAEVARSRGCGRMEWSALDWNALAIEFYLGLGAERMHEWDTFRLEGTALARVAAQAPVRRK